LSRMRPAASTPGDCRNRDEGGPLVWRITTPDRRGHGDAHLWRISGLRAPTGGGRVGGRRLAARACRLQLGPRRRTSTQRCHGRAFWAEQKHWTLAASGPLLTAPARPSPTRPTRPARVGCEQQRAPITSRLCRLLLSGPRLLRRRQQRDPRQHQGRCQSALHKRCAYRHKRASQIPG